MFFFFFSSRRRHTIWNCDWSSDVCSSDLIMPQRWFFDAFILWLIPKTRREILFTAVFSWGAGIWRWYQFPHSFSQVGRWAVLLIYLPMLVVILARTPAKRTTRGSSG